jgi:hypothetical protein
VNVDKMRHQLDRTAPIDPRPKWVQEQAVVFANVGIAMQDLVRNAQAYFARGLIADGLEKEKR